MKKKNWNLIIGLIITGIFLAMAIIGRFWTPYSTTAMSAMEMNQAPSLAHWMGTDNFGRDIFSRVMNGSGSTFIIAVCTVTFGCIVGTIVGALTGYYGGLFDNIIMRLNDILLSFPSLVRNIILLMVNNGTQLYCCYYTICPLWILKKLMWNTWHSRSLIV